MGRPTPIDPRSLHRFGTLQQLLHAGPALARRFFRGAAAGPMGFETDCETIAVALKRFELPCPVDHPLAHRRPFVAFCSLHCVLAMAMTNAVFRQKIVAVGICDLPLCGGVSWVPIQHKM